MTPKSSATLFDVFPLTPKLYFAYDYDVRSYFVEAAYFVQTSVDSGLIEYLVHDSLILNDSTIAWSIEERRSLWRLRINRYTGLDTSYWTHDTVFFSLYQNTSGQYELTASGTVWRFPTFGSKLPAQRYTDNHSVVSDVRTIHRSTREGGSTRFGSQLGGGYTRRYGLKAGVAVTQ